MSILMSILLIILIFNINNINNVRLILSMLNINIINKIDINTIKYFNKLFDSMSFLSIFLCYIFEIFKLGFLL